MSASLVGSEMCIRDRSRLSVGPEIGAKHPADVPRCYAEAGPGTDPDSLHQVAVGEDAEEAAPGDGYRRRAP
eukprot:6998282-Alexandrium_andersonii.AAC.1